MAAREAPTIPATPEADTPRRPFLRRWHIERGSALSKVARLRTASPSMPVLHYLGISVVEGWRFHLNHRSSQASTHRRRRERPHVSSTPRSRWVRCDGAISDGGGVSLIVRTTGVGWWRLRYWISSRENTLSLGTYPAVSLASARQRRRDAQRLIAQGVGSRAS